MLKENYLSRTLSCITIDVLVDAIDSSGEIGLGL